MEDTLQRSAIEDQIANFGQTPIQIFSKKHPRRGPPMPIGHPLYFAPSSITLTSVIPNATNSSSPIIFVGLLESNIVIVCHGLILSVKLWLTTQLQSGGNYTFSGSQVLHILLYTCISTVKLYHHHIFLIVIIKYTNLSLSMQIIPKGFSCRK